MRAAATLALIALAAVVAAQTPDPARPAGLHTHRDGFSGRQTAWLQGDSNVTVTEKDHRIDTVRYFNAPSSEYLKVEGRPSGNTADAEFAHYYYETPPAPLTDATTVRVYVKAYRPGIQLRARVVLPKEKDPKNPDAPLTTLITGDSYPDEKVRYWHPLKVPDPAGLLRKQLPVLTARLGRQPDPEGAYIDRLVLNVYPGPGVTEVNIDDLEIGPCRPDPRKPGGPRGLAATPAGRSVAHPYPVEFIDGRILVDKKPFFMRMIRHTDTGSAGLKELRDAKFNTVYFPADADPALVDEAVTKHQFMVVAGVPDGPADFPVGTGAAEREADRLAEHFRRFRSGDGVLMWDLGGGRTTEQLKTVTRTAELFREYDPRRPRAVDLWDGYGQYADYLDVIGAHRWPLFTSLGLDRYGDWLTQRKALTGPGKLMWTWVQTHAPEWYTSLANGGRPAAVGAAPDFPYGPQPEQLRLLTYLSVASGYRGLGFWSDRALANSHHGRDRLIELFLLNCEMELLEPALAGVEDEKTEWVKTSHNQVRAAVLRGKRGIVVLPVWVGNGAQHCVEQAAIPELKIKVPQVPEGADPWLLTPASYLNLRSSGGVKPVPPGVEITIPNFDLTAAVVFTQETGQGDGLPVRWQDNIRNTFGRRAAEYAKEQAVEAYNKTLAVHQQLAGVAPQVEGAEDLLKSARFSVRQAERYLDNGQPDMAYREARQALRPLRVLMRDHWENATKSLSVPTSSPFAASFYTLPQHWELVAQLDPVLRALKPGGNVLPHGGFELSGPAPADGAQVESLPGWTVRQSTLDPVTLTAVIVDADKAADKPRPRAEKQPVPGTVVGKYSSGRVEAARNPGEKPGPTPSRHVLKLHVTPKPIKGVAEEDLKQPGALERTFLAADSPAVELPAGTWVRISFWAKVPGTAASADGVLVYDSAGGEPLAARIYDTDDATYRPTQPRWREYHLYRQVPASGRIGVTFALTGLGLAYFDDVRVVPLGAVAVGEKFTVPKAGPAGELVGRGKR